LACSIVDLAPLLVDRQAAIETGLILVLLERFRVIQRSSRGSYVTPCVVWLGTQQSLFCDQKILMEFVIASLIQPNKSNVTSLYLWSADLDILVASVL
jgi:hypothetical protein